MKTLILGALAGLALVVSAGAANVQIPVTPDKMIQGRYEFGISNSVVGGGSAFHVTIAAKTGTIAFSCGADLAVVTQPTDTTPFSITGVKPATAVNLQKSDQQWTADFTAPSEIINRPDVYFIFVVPDFQTTPDGKEVALPSEKIYEMKLQDFVTH